MSSPLEQALMSGLKATPARKKARSYPRIKISTSKQDQRVIKHQPATPRIETITITTANPSTDATDDDSTHKKRKKARRSHKISSHPEDGGGHPFERLVREALDSEAEWQNLELGKLVRLISQATFHCKKKKTVQFILRTCVHRVDVDFLQGLNLPLKPQQLMQILHNAVSNLGGSNSQMQLFCLIAECIEGEFFDLSDVGCVTEIVACFHGGESHWQEHLELMTTLFSSLSTLRDGFELVKALVKAWHLAPKQNFVQRLVLVEVVQDLEGDLDQVVGRYFPELRQVVTLPSMIPEDDVDEAGNLEGFIASEEDECSMDEEREEEEEREPVRRSRIRNPFILEEASEESDTGIEMDDNEDDLIILSSEEERKNVRVKKRKKVVKKRHRRLISSSIEDNSSSDEEDWLHDMTL